MDQHAQPENRHRGDVIPWLNLTEAERREFEEAFQMNEARFARSDATFQRKGDADVGMAHLLAVLSEIQQRNREIRACLDPFRYRLSKIDPEKRALVESFFELEEQGEEQESAALAKITQFMKMWVMLGAWGHLKWLAKYGLEHAPDGISSSRPGAIPPNFPDSSRVVMPDPNGIQLKEVVLAEFLRLSQMPPIALHVATCVSQSPRTLEDYARIRDLPPPRMLADFLPAGLPTKAHLREAVEVRWFAITREEIDLDRRFTDCIKLLGLAGLPQADKSWLA